jgi:uncharacterized iron-regulated protein
MNHRIPAVLLCLAACGGSYRASSAPVKGVAAAGLPYTILDARTGHQLDTAAFWTTLAGARAVCIGEEHPNPHHHWVQLEVVRHLVEVARPFGVGLEMVQRPFQGVLDDYAARRIDDAALIARTGWVDRWGYDYALYQPILAVAVAHGAALRGLNASKELVAKVAHTGLESLDPTERAALPELVLDDAKHRAWFDAIMASMGASAHGHTHGAGHAMPHDAAHAGVTEPGAMPHDAAHAGVTEPGAMPHDAAHAGVTEPGDEGAEAPADPAQEQAAADRMYSVQVLWDESMADGAATWLKEDPKRAIAILAGDGHCHDSAIVGRLKRRGITAVVSLRPVIDDGQGSVAELLAAPENDYLIVLQPPKE